MKAIAHEAMASAAAPQPRRTKAEKFWDRLARAWSQPVEESEASDTKVLAKTRPYLKATDVVLDFGCAKGSVDLRLAASVKAICGIDISSKMIADARDAADSRGVANVSFKQATLFDESLERESFDVIMAFNIFHLLEDAPAALRRIEGLLKPEGVLISVTPCLAEKRTLLVGMVMLAVRVAVRLRMIPYVWRCTIDGLRNSMDAAGLAAVETEELVHSTSEYFVVARKGTEARPQL